MPSALIRLIRRCFGAGLLLLSTGLFTRASANNDTWLTRTWTTDDGLVNNNILAVVQGLDGYLWVVPSVGLMRFDGLQFRRFPIENFTGPVDDHIICALLSRRTGTFWVATYGGILIGIKSDFSKEKISAPSLTDGVPLALAEDNAGSLWVGYVGAVCRITAGQVTRFGATEGVPPGDYHSLVSDGAGNIWLAKGNQICFFKDGQFQRAASSRGTRSLATTRTNAVWFVDEDRLGTCDTDGVTRNYGSFPDLALATRRALLEDHTGAVWIGTDGNGLIHFDKSGFQKIDTTYPSILNLAEDHEGNLWLGTAGGGLNRVSLSGVRLESVPVSERIESLCEDTNGVLWGADHAGMLVSHVNDQWIPVLTNAPFAGTARAVASDNNGAVWIGTRDGKLFQLAGTNSITAHQTTIHGIIYALLTTASNDVWIIGSNEVQRWHDGELSDIRLPRTIGKISAVTEDAAGNIWIGAKGMVMRFNGKEFVDETPHLPIAECTVCCLYGTPDGSVWISCGGLGLLRYQNGHVGRVGLEQGLFNDYIAQIVADDHGWLWFGSDHGVFKIRRQDLEQASTEHGDHLRPIVYGRNEGLPSLQALFSTSSFVLPIALHDRDGRVRLLTSTGVVVADPKLLPENSTTPVLLTQMAMDGQTIASYGSASSTQTVANLKTLDLSLRLPPAHRHLEFDFTAFHFSAPENIRFRYKLAGFDNDWIEAGGARNADYSRLTAGHYEFQVAACVGDGPWNESPAALPFTVTPFFWQTWWFRLSALLLFTSAIIAIIRYVSFRRMQLKLRAAEQLVAVERERGRIARDLHDDLGGSLNLAALTLDLTEGELEDRASLNGKIQRCSTLVRQAARSVDEIVWAINPRNDTLGYLVDYISQFAVEFLQAADILCLVELPDNIPNQRISPEARHNLWLVSKEAVNNIVRHAHASEVYLRVTISENQLAVSIKDNGRGFEWPQDNAECDGLRNMRQRMEEIGGKFQLHSRPGNGTHIVVLYSWPPQT